MYLFEYINAKWTLNSPNIWHHLSIKIFCRHLQYSSWHATASGSPTFLSILARKFGMFVVSFLGQFGCGMGELEESAICIAKPVINPYQLVLKWNTPGLLYIYILYMCRETIMVFRVLTREHASQFAQIYQFSVGSSQTAKPVLCAATWMQN